MAYFFDGANDNVNFGSDAAIDGFTALTITAWITHDNAGLLQHITGKDRSGASSWAMRITAAEQLGFLRTWTGAVAQPNWVMDNVSLATGSGLNHVGVTYNGTGTTAEPLFYFNGVSGLAQWGTGSPTGTLVSDAARSLISGESGAGTNDFTGKIGWVVYHNTILGDEAINRAKWWGTPGGNPIVYQPMVTDTVNRGSSAITGVVTGAVRTSLPRVERNWGSVMGCGR